MCARLDLFRKYQSALHEKQDCDGGSCVIRTMTHMLYDDNPHMTDDSKGDTARL